MVEQMIVKPTKVRGQGNVLPTPSLEDYTISDYSKLELKENGALGLKYYINPSIKLTLPSEFIIYKATNKYNIECLVLDEYNELRANQEVIYSIDNSTPVTDKTNSEGILIITNIMGSTTEEQDRKTGNLLKCTINQTNNNPYVSESINTHYGCKVTIGTITEV